MATFVITNASASQVYLRDLYVTLGAAGQKSQLVGPIDTVTTVRPVDDFNKMQDLMAKVAAGTVSVAITPDSSEVGNDLLVPPSSVTGNDTAPVAAATIFAAVPTVVRFPITAGAASASDTAVIALNAIPYKFRVLDAYVKVTTASGANNVTVQTRAAGAGTAIMTVVSTAALGLVRETSTAVVSPLVVPSAADGIFIRNSASAAWAGEIILTIRKEV
jgi:hypothetical protein